MRAYTALSLCIVALGVSAVPVAADPPAKLKYYGYYFVEDPDKGQRYIDEVKDFTNLVNMRYDNGAQNSWDPVAARRVKESGLKVMLQVPFGSDWDQTVFVDRAARQRYLQQIKQDMIRTEFLSSLAYFAIYEEWYVLISQGFYDKWPIFQGQTKEQKFAIAKGYLEQIIDDVHDGFPGIPTVIVENILPYPEPPANVDVLGIDAYYIPTDGSCDATQRAKFESEVFPYFDAAAAYGKPIMMVAPCFVGGPWRMLSTCQMQWYSDLARSGPYPIESLLWFFYANTGGMAGVRNYPDLVRHQRAIGAELLAGAAPAPAPAPAPESPANPANYAVHLQVDSGQYIVAEGDGGGAINADRGAPGPWETFTLIDLNGGKLENGDRIGIRTGSGQYFRAEGGGGSSMDATARELGPWETFAIEKPTGGTIASGDRIHLRAASGSHYLVAEYGGGRELAADRTQAYAWETFVITFQGAQRTSGARASGKGLIGRLQGLR